LDTGTPVTEKLRAVKSFRA